MTRIGYHCSHEQYPPSELLRRVKAAEAAGFEAAMCSDHIHPWTETQGHSGFAWSFLGAALEATSFSFGVVTVPGGWRYHPAILAQAAATLEEMYPDRFWLAAGSGEALNEHIVRRGWPDKPERNARLAEGVDIMRALWRGEEVTREAPIPTEGARVYSLPERAPRVYAAALTPDTARFAGAWADGLITTGRPPEDLAQMREAFEEGGGAGKPLVVQATFALADSEREALDEACHEWGCLFLDPDLLGKLRRPADFAAAAAALRPEDLKGKLPTVTSAQEAVDWLAPVVEMGVAEIQLHCVNRREDQFLELFGERVIPALRAALQP